MLKRRHIRRELKYDKIRGLITTSYPVSMQEAGHMRVKVNGKSYRMVEVLWCYVHGELHEHAKIVQLDGNKLNFQIDNLALDNSKIISDALSKNKGYDFVSDLPRGFNHV